ncbi:MAG TPA: hypothetical protein VK435_03275 [Thermodesulfovibrionales bacterium]|nr:hypothetical protein [Thermodesulfovibrionales bacterium]
MSLWLYKRDKSGKNIVWQVDFDPISVMVILGLLAALLSPSFFRDPSVIGIFPFSLLTAGLACLIISKISLYKKGIWFSFGPGPMTKGCAKLYKIAYSLLGIGALLLIVSLSAMRGA